MRPQGIISLCDYTGVTTAPWVAAGYEVLHVDPQRENNGTVLEMARHIAEFIQAVDVRLVAAYPPCTDVAVSGAAWFESKAAKDKHFQAKAALIAEQCRMVGLLSGAPFFFENPVSVFSSIFGPPDFTFHPWEYGGYLPEDDAHPLWPDYIAPRDHYNKKTCLWTGNGFVLPEKKPLNPPNGTSAQHRRLGGRSRRTKNIRSATPRGFAKALFDMYGGPF